MALIYANENFPRRVVMALRDLGHDVLTSQEAGRSNLAVADADVLDFAITQRRAVLTLNRLDFFRLHQSRNGNHFGIIACTRDDADPADFALRIHQAMERCGNLEQQLVRVIRSAA